MKRLIFLTCVLLFVAAFLPVSASSTDLRGFERAAGYQYVTLGNYPQDEDGAVRPILWRVLSVRDGEALLLSEYVLDHGCVHPDDKAFVAMKMDYTKTDVFARLNGAFAEMAFSEQELSLLRQDEALGRVFLLSSEELRSEKFGFLTNKLRKALGTPYAVANGLFQYGNGSSPYWMRTPSTMMLSGMRCTKVDGAIGYIRCVVNNEGIRPAIRLVLDAPFAGGQGTKSDPFHY